MWKKTLATGLAAVGLWTAAGPAVTQTPVTETYTYDASGELVGVERTGPPPPSRRQSLAEGAASDQTQAAPGSTIAATNAGVSGNVGRMQFNGQMWLPDMGVYHYKSRVYHPGLGRFMQTDPVGYAEGMNLYAYVRNDPVNRTDPDGRQSRSCALMGTGCQATRQQDSAWARAAPVAGVAVDFMPIAGDVKGLIETARNPSALGVAAAAIGLIPGVGDLGGAALRNSDLVVRGGTNSAERFAMGSGVVRETDGTLSGVSVNSAPGLGAAELGSTLMHNRIGVTTVGNIRAAGGTVTSSPSAANPYHCTVCGITAAQGQQLFTPTVRNPNPRRRQP